VKSVTFCAQALLGLVTPLDFKTAWVIHIMGNPYAKLELSATFYTWVSGRHGTDGQTHSKHCLWTSLWWGCEA